MATRKNADGSVTVGILHELLKSAEPGEQPGLAEPEKPKAKRKAKSK